MFFKDAKIVQFLALVVIFILAFLSKYIGPYWFLAGSLLLVMWGIYIALKLR